MGDFNTYIDYEYPLELFKGTVSNGSRCVPSWHSINFNFREGFPSPPFEDLWETMHPSDPGFTFLIDIPPLVKCRPDRVLLRRSGCAKISDVYTTMGLEYLTAQELQSLKAISPATPWLSDHVAVIGILDISSCGV